MKARPYVSSYTSFSKAKNIVPNCMHFRSYLRKWINCRYAYRGTFFYDSLKFKLHGSRVLGRKNTGNRKLFLPASTRKRSFFRTKGEKDLSSDRGVKSDSQGWLFIKSIYWVVTACCTSIWGRSDIWGWFRNMSSSKRFPCHLLLNWGRQTNVPGGKAARPHIHKRKIRKFKLDPWMVKGNICGNLQGFFILEGFEEEGSLEPKMGSPAEPEVGMGSGKSWTAGTGTSCTGASGFVGCWLAHRYATHHTSSEVWEQSKAHPHRQSKQDWADSLDTEK